jgi:hypothetical protein
MKMLSAESLQHTTDQLVDLVLAISEVTTIDIMVALLAPSAGWSVQFEGPEEVVDLLEDASNGEKLVDHVLDTLDVVSVTQFALDHKVVGDRNAASSVLLKHKNKFHCSMTHNQLLTLTNPRL